MPCLQEVLPPGSGIPHRTLLLSWACPLAPWLSKPCPAHLLFNSHLHCVEPGPHLSFRSSSPPAHTAPTVLSPFAQAQHPGGIPDPSVSHPRARSSASPAGSALRINLRSDHSSLWNSKICLMLAQLVIPPASSHAEAGLASGSHRLLPPLDH